MAREIAGIFTFFLIIVMTLTFSCRRWAKREKGISTGNGSYESILTAGSIKNKPGEISWWTEGNRINGINNESVNFINLSIENWFKNPAQIPDFTISLAGRINEARDNTSLLHIAHQLNCLSAGGYGPPVSGAVNKVHASNSPDKRLSALRKLKESPSSGGIGLIWDERSPGDFRSADTVIQSLIIDLLNLVCNVNKTFNCFYDSEQYNRFAKGNNLRSSSDIQELIMFPFSRSEIGSNSHKLLFRSFDMQVLAYSSRLLTEGVNEIIKRYSLGVADNISPEKIIEMETSFGAIALLTNRSDTINKPYFLVIDPGGDDYYNCDVALALGKSRPVSICIDAGGDDQYGNIDCSNSICSSTLGLSTLVDLEGNDSYYSSGRGLSFSAGGSAILEDSGGDDKYVGAGTHTIASSYFGFAMLVDRHGKDEYLSGSYSQGFGGTGGVALLIDIEGDDTYQASGASFCQGSARGRWADATDGQNMGGGYGILTDLSGDDKYFSGYFSQGSSYYHGMGILNDLEGDDRYNSLTHSQGVAIHTSLACFADLSGNDSYNADSDISQSTQSIGYGRDRSYAFFIDESGDDSYIFGNKSFGTGDINATGIAVDIDGNDSYLWVDNRLYQGSESFGSAQGLQKGMSINNDLFLTTERFTAGIALDLRGDDRYLLLKEGYDTICFFRNRKSQVEKKDNTLKMRKDE